MFFLAYQSYRKSKYLHGHRNISSKNVTLKGNMGDSRCLFSPQGLFDQVSDVLRSGIKARQKQGPRFIFCYTFASKVGLFPYRHGGFSATKTVKILCNHTKCTKCGRCWPSESRSYNLSIQKTIYLTTENGYKRRDI